ncbi:hypothetical protein GCM10027160_03950 [Streptomyces calidiresistens]
MPEGTASRERATRDGPAPRGTVSHISPTGGIRPRVSAVPCRKVSARAGPRPCRRPTGPPQGGGGNPPIAGHPGGHPADGMTAEPQYDRRTARRAPAGRVPEPDTPEPEPVPEA